MKDNTYKELANTLRKSADILDKISDLKESNIDKKEKEEKEEMLLAEFMVQMMKIERIKL